MILRNSNGRGVTPRTERGTVQVFPDAMSMWNQKGMYPATPSILEALLDY